MLFLSCWVFLWRCVVKAFLRLKLIYWGAFGCYGSHIARFWHWFNRSNSFYFELKFESPLLGYFKILVNYYLIKKVSSQHISYFVSLNFASIQLPKKGHCFQIAMPILHRGCGKFKSCISVYCYNIGKQFQSSHGGSTITVKHQCRLVQKAGIPALVIWEGDYG